MKKSSIFLLQAVLVIIALAVLAFLIIEPRLEGRNVGASLFEIYFKDPFLAVAYIASLSVFGGIYQAFKLLVYIGNNEVFTEKSVRALRNIKYCASVLVGFAVLGEAWLFTIQKNNSDDIAGGVFMGLLLIFASGVVATAAAVFERLLQTAVDIKSENDLTV